MGSARGAPAPYLADGGGAEGSGGPVVPPMPGSAGLYQAAAATYPGGPTLQLARRRRGPKDDVSRQAQAHRRWTSIPVTSDEWKGWETEQA